MIFSEIKKSIKDLQLYLFKKYCIVTREAGNCGLFSYYIMYLGAASWCKKRKMVPIFDMTNANPYLEVDKVGKENSWEYYYEQLCAKVFDKRNSSDTIEIDVDKVILENIRPHIGMDFLLDEKKLKYWRGIDRKYIHIRDDIREEIDFAWTNMCDLFRKTNKSDIKVLGVICRGTDYIALRPKGHPKQPTIHELSGVIDEFLDKKGYTHIYLATEDEDIYSDFVEKYGDIVSIYNNKRYSDTGDVFLSELIKEDSRDLKEFGKKYLIQIALLSKCDGLIGGRCSGLVGALIMADSFEDTFFYDNGVY